MSTQIVERHQRSGWTRSLFWPALLVLSSLLLFSPTDVSAQPQSRVIVPKAGWVSIYFETIDGLVREMGLAPLRSAAVRPGDIEFRMWDGFGIGDDRGFVFRRHGGKWSALAIEKRPYRKPRLLEVAKAMDWAAVWDQLQRAGIDEIKDASDSPSCRSVTDGIGYVVEIATPDHYRTYLVNNPQDERTESGDRFLAIVPTIYRAFGMEAPSDVSRLPRGEMRVLASVSQDPPPTVDPATPGEWVLNQHLVPALRQIELRSDEAYAQGINLRGPRCEELPTPLRFMRVTGDVPVAVLIDPDGSVLDARALGGPPLLQRLTATFALGWKFAPIVRKEIRTAVMTVRYRKEWFPFPWIK